MLFYLVFIHLIGDIILQPDRYASLKNKVLRYMLIHCYVYAGAVSVGLFLVGRFSLLGALILFISHFLIDTYVRDDVNDPFKLNLYGWVDQLLHIAVLTGVYLWIY